MLKVDDFVWFNLYLKPDQPKVRIGGKIIAIDYLYDDIMVEAMSDGWGTKFSRSKNQIRKMTPEEELLFRLEHE